MDRPDFVYNGVVGFSISNRAQAAAELAAKLVTQAAYDQQVKEWLRSVAPEEIRDWIEDESVINVVYTHGCFSFRVKFDYTNTDHLKKMIRKLNKAWKGLIQAKLTNIVDIPYIQFAAINGTRG